MIEIILDASQLETFETCPRKWYYSYKQNLIPNVAHRAFGIGSYYHEVLALYYSLPLGPLHYNNIPESKDIYKHQLAKYGVISSFAERIRATIDFSINTELLNKFGIKDLDEQKFHRRRIFDYLSKYEDEDQAIEVIAVEQGFSWLLYEDSSRRYILEGKIDFVGKGRPYDLFVMDHKTQSRFDDRWEMNHQVMNYMSFTKANYFIYNYIGLQEKLPINGMRRMIYKPHPGMLEQWQKEVKETFDQMFHYILMNSIVNKENDICYPRRRAACDASKYGLCAYHKLCSVPDESPFKLTVFSGYKEKEEKWSAWR